MEWRHPSMIAMKGYPYTGKTSIAIRLGRELRFCLLLSLDDILDSITPTISYSSINHDQQQLIQQAFDILCNLAEHQLSLGLSVIIDSPLLSFPHLHRLVHLARSSNAAKFIIVECRVKRDYAWQMRFKRKHEPDPLRLESGSSGSMDEAWFKAKDWDQDVVKIVNSYDQRLDDPIPGVSRLLLNVDGIVRAEHVIEALQALVFCQDDRHLDYDKWMNYDHFSTSTQQERTGFCKHGHWMAEFKEDGIDYEADCGVCNKFLEGPAYCCKHCTLALHKSCAEMARSFTPLDFPAFISWKPLPDHPNHYFLSYSFPERFTCLLCREAGEGYSDKCLSCIYQSHLKCRLLPTVINHDGHEHRLSFWAMEISGRHLYKCAACGKEGADFGYECCVCDGIYYHLGCVLLPYPLKEHIHGGYTHPLELMFNRENRDFDDFPCDRCLGLLAPDDWYYHCEKCEQTYHLHCAFLPDHA